MMVESDTCVDASSDANEVAVDVLQPSLHFGYLARWALTQPLERFPSFVACASPSDKSLGRMAARPRVWVIRMLAWVLGSLFRHLFSRLHVTRTMMDIRSEPARAAVLLIPYHRSHIDYLLVSYACFALQEPIPLIAAGQNLALPFVRSVLRRGGAFFLRRRFGDNSDKYRDIFQTYLDTLIRSGASTEVFVEGGRSRTGRMLPPKNGFTRMCSDIVWREHLERPDHPDGPLDVQLMPVSISYESVWEAESMAAERSGDEKVPESIFGLLKGIYDLCRVPSGRMGHAHIHFGRRISLREHLISSHEQGLSLCSGVDRCVNELLCELDDNTRISLPALASLVLIRASWRLDHKPNAICGRDLLRELAILQSLMLKGGGLMMDHVIDSELGRILFVMGDSLVESVKRQDHIDVLYVRPGGQPWFVLSHMANMASAAWSKFAIISWSLLSLRLKNINLPIPIRWLIKRARCVESILLHEFPSRQKHSTGHRNLVEMLADIGAVSICDDCVDAVLHPVIQTLGLPITNLIDAQWLAARCGRVLLQYWRPVCFTKQSLVSSLLLIGRSMSQDGHLFVSSPVCKDSIVGAVHRLLYRGFFVKPLDDEFQLTANNELMMDILEDIDEISGMSEHWLSDNCCLCEYLVCIRLEMKNC